MSKDYYNTLGVSKNASQDEIKKAFRAKAHQHHPDKKGGNEAKFKEINEAYQVLGDAKKRSQYDQFGSAFQSGQAGGAYGGGFGGGFQDFSGGFSAGGFNINLDDLGEMFSEAFSGGGRSRRTKKGADIETILEIEFKEAVFGAEKKISLAKNNQCARCDGQGVEPGAKVETCKTCSGKGKITKIQRTILGAIQVQSTCDECGGDGKTYSEKCQDCGGLGISHGKSELKIKVPAGIDNDQTIRLAGHGEAGQKGASSGDLYLVIKVKPHPKFKRDDTDIYSREEISFPEAALGTKIEVETINGSVKLKIPEGTQSGTKFRLRGQGVERLNQKGFFSAQNIRGDHLVEIIVKTPTKLTRKQKNLLEELSQL